MAQRVQVVLVDDIDGSEAVETVSFSLDGSSYEIDLSAANAAKLRDAFDPWVSASRRTAGRKAVARARGANDAGRIREWAKANGYEVSERGRVSAKVREAYKAAH